MARVFPPVVVMAVLGAVGGCHERAGGGVDEVDAVDLIVTNATIRTMDDQRSVASALAVRDGRVMFVGDEAGALALAGEGTERLDLGGAAVLPGFIDVHGHFVGLGGVLDTLDLTGTTSVRQAAAMAAQACAAAAPGAWVYGRGWDDTRWDPPQLPSWRDLDGCPDNPVYLSRVDGHVWWVNSKALQLAGITRDTLDPDGGRIVRDGAGEPAGVVIDTAKFLVRAAIPDETPEQLRQRIGLAQTACLSAGLVGVGDPGLKGHQLDALEAAARDGDLRIRVYAMLDDEDDLLEARLSAGPRVGLYDDRLTIRCVKLYADGALGSRGAALLEPYRDDPGNSGLLVDTPERLEHITRRALAAGFQVATHAIGDRAVRLVLDVYAAALAEHFGAPRLRIEHAQVVHADDMERFAALGVIPSMQPTHATSDMLWAVDRLGPGRLAGAYAWRTLRDTGVRFPLGSDFPVESYRPLWGIHAAVTRQDRDGEPAGGWMPDQRLTIDEAIAGFTIEAAYAQFEEADRGSIEVGKLADLIVLDADPFTADPTTLHDMTVLRTIIGGETVFVSGI